MKKLVACIYLVLVPLISAQIPLQPSQSPPTVRPVSVLFTATDSAGNPVRDMSKEQLVVLDNNIYATVADVHSVSEAPLSLGIVLLASKTNFSKEQAAAVELVRKLIRSNRDRAFVITAGGDKPWTQANLEWQSDRDGLISAINQLDKNTGLPDSFNYDLATYSGDTASSSARFAVQTYENAGPSVFDAVWGMMTADKRPARRVLVIFRNPWSHASGLSQRSREYADQKHMRLIAIAQQLHVVIHSIGLEESSPASNSSLDELRSSYGMNGMGDTMREVDRQIKLEKDRQYSDGRGNVRRLAEETGGRAWWSNKKDYRDVVGGIDSELTGQYLLTFVPASGTPGSHQLKITSTHAHLSAPNAFTMAGPVPHAH